MNKTSLKNFAIAARLELLGRVKDRAAMYGVTREKVEACEVVISSRFQKLGGEMLSRREIAQRNALLGRVALLGFDQAMEEAAYTWFNRFIALRYMQEHNLLPVDVRALPQAAGELPQIVREAQNVSLPGVDIAAVAEMLDANRTEELYKYLLIALCNALSAPLPRMFEAIEDYTELLFPDGILKAESVLGMLAGVDAENWRDIQVSGWMYQFYVTELNELVYDGSMSRSRIPKELLPAATTIYTPDWPVKYMVENSLGRLWLEGHPNDALKSNWRYYLDEAEQEPQVQAKLDELRAGYASLRPEDIRVIDPCCGSGHIAVYMFDVLMQIYESQGWTRRDAVRSILENNLYALDIDDRAAQFAYFAVMMKAAEYDPRFLRREEVPQPKVYPIEQSLPIAESTLASLVQAKPLVMRLVADFVDAKSLGSIIRPSLTFEELAIIRAELSRGDMVNDALRQQLDPLLAQAEILSQQYDVVVTNPPYLGSSRLEPVLEKHVKENYADVKSDLCMVMYKRALEGFVKPSGLVAFITTSSWMFLSSFEKLRKFVAESASISTLVDFGTELFEGKVGHNPIVSWITRETKLNYTMIAIRLVDYCYARREEKEPEFFKARNRYTARQDNFAKIPGAPVAYWLSTNSFNAYKLGKILGSLVVSRVGLQTSDNNRFLRFWFECSNKNLRLDCHSIVESQRSPEKWYPHNKGGSYRKWYGNNEYVINYAHAGYELSISDGAATIPEKYAFREALTFSRVSSGATSFRFQTANMIFDSAAVSIFTDEISLQYLLAVLNSKVTKLYLSAIAPTINTQPGDVIKIPIIFSDGVREIVSERVQDNISLSRADWDSFETSWDFQRHPLI